MTSNVRRVDMGVNRNLSTFELVIAACFGLCVFSTARWLQQPIALTPTADAAEITPQLDVF